MSNHTVRCMNPACHWYEKDRKAPPLQQVGEGLYRVPRIMCECGEEVWKGTPSPSG